MDGRKVDEQGNLGITESCGLLVLGNPEDVGGVETRLLVVA